MTKPAPTNNRFDAPKLSPLKRALRNGLLIAIVVAIVTHLQDAALQESLMSALFTLVIVTPALWLSYRLTQKLLTRSSDPTPDKADPKKSTEAD
ncbi:MAG: hypothetical protein ACP5D0_06165 [Hydrogenovibrio sp.]